MTNAPWPKDLAFAREARELRITFDDSAEFTIPFELLRVESPSAEARGHGGADRPIIRGKQNVMALEAKPVGRYAVRIIFDDGHSSGLYSWAFLYELGKDKDARDKAYRERIA